MEKIDEQLNNLSLVEVPIGVHHSVMRKVHYQKIKPVLLVAFCLLVFNFLAIAWHINMKLIDADFLDMTRDFLDVFSFNLSFIDMILGSFFEIISPALVLSAVLSFAGAIYLGKKINIYQFGEI
jgi:hypothetical protein